MNRAFAAMVFVLACLSSPSPVQSADVGEPEYIGVIAARSPATNEWTQLERLKPTVESRVRGLGFGGGEARGVFQGERSPVRFKAGQPLEFVIRVERQDKDPVSLIQFYRLDPANGRRTLQLAAIRNPLTMRSNQDQLRSHTIAFNSSKLGTNFFVFSSTQPLEPGEYTVGSMGVDDGFNFGIDP